MGLDAIFHRSNWPDISSPLWSAVIFWFGCMVGSFLNVCIYRMPIGKSVVSPPSHCPHCKYSIPWYLNVPLLTWLTLRGRCKNCRAPISVRYFLVELLTGLMFLAAWISFGQQSAAVALIYCFVLAGLITATFIDFEHFIIPDEITIGGMVVGVICSALVPVLHCPPGAISLMMAIKQSVLGMAVGAGVVYFIVRLGKILFGRLNLDLDPGSTVIFHETGISLPPKRIDLAALTRLSSGWLAFRADVVELPDRCVQNVTVALSADGLIVDGQRFNKDNAPHVEFLVGKMLSPSETAKIAGVEPAAASVIADHLRGGWRLFLGLFGFRRWPHLESGSHLVATDGGVLLQRGGVLFEEMFYRKSDKIRLLASRLEIQSGIWTHTEVEMSQDALRIGDATFNPEAVSRMEVVTDALVVPREAMGFGDVKFMGAIGAFLGWQATIFSLVASSFIGATVGVMLILMRQRQLTAKLPYGPYIALAAVIWMFWGRAIMQAAENWMQM